VDDAWRFNGEILQNLFVSKLENHVDFVPVCPEVEIGLGTPRPVVRLVRPHNSPFHCSHSGGTLEAITTVRARSLNVGLTIEGTLSVSPVFRCARLTVLR
jgi:uncharacterized protein YbbK (DUF523 family)